MNDIKQLITKHFPFKTFNPGQYEAIEKTVLAFQSKKKHVILQAPTGIGKSAIATTVHRVMKDLNNGFRTTIVTATKGLQDQYEQADEEIYSLKGKLNYTCPMNVGPYNSAGCRSLVGEGNCNKAVVCPYVKRRTHWCLTAPLRLTNTAFQIEACPMLVMEPENRANLIIIDECHDLDEQLIDHNTLKVSVDELEHLKKATDESFVRIFVDFINDFLEMPPGTAFEVSDEMSEDAMKIYHAAEAQIARLEELLEQKPKNKDSVAGAIEEIQQISDKMKIFGEGEGEWMVTDFAFGSLVELKPIYAYQVAKHGMFRKADMFLHMSATICGFDAYMETLGIEKHEAVVFDIPNPIPVANRKVYALSKMKVSGDYDRMILAQTVDKIIDRHKGQNGIIHSVSFQLAKDLKENSKYGRTMIISNNRSEILQTLNEHNSGKIIVSPSIEKGYDFKGDMSRWQVIAKIPFLSLSDQWVKLNMSRQQSWYSRKAILRLVQASGRSIRGVDDHASTYIIDSNFDNLLNRHRDIFPDWFLESLVLRR